MAEMKFLYLVIGMLFLGLSVMLDNGALFGISFMAIIAIVVSMYYDKHKLNNPIGV